MTADLTDNNRDKSIADLDPNQKDGLQEVRPRLDGTRTQKRLNTAQCSANRICRPTDVTSSRAGQAQCMDTTPPVVLRPLRDAPEGAADKRVARK